MASSLLTTDKRWAAPTRKSGMTVLGKIPKPINLPSQRLENQGLDPNVEIVPKGTHTWGSKPGPTTPNAWNSSSLLSPKKDGSIGAPSQFNGRPSSGGGSRPSTAGSESLDSPNAWGPNSRPSSSSGTLPSQHLPVVTNRPRSAETRPGSSQLSRFADNPSEHMNVSIRTFEKPGSSHGHGFTLSTGDFPTLGAEKTSDSNSQRGHSSKGRPTSSSGKDGAQNDQGKSPTAGPGEVIRSPNNQPADILKTDQHAHDGGAPFPATAPPNEAQQPQPYPPNYGMPPPQFDSWRAPPGHPPEGMWHRGPGGPYRQVGPPSSFPVEPFTYYGQFPPNSEAAARQGTGHGGYHSKNGDAYHSMRPNSYVMNQPVIPVRPVYQGPMPYDGYYGPPRANFNNANVRDVPFIGGSHLPGILNQFPNHNDKFQPGNSQSRPVKHEAVSKELMESDRVHLVPRGQTRILHDNPDRVGPGEVERKIQPVPPLLPHPDGNRNDVNLRADTRSTSSERNMVLMKSVHDQRERGPDRLSHSSVSENAHSHPRGTDDVALRKKIKDDNLPLDQQPIIKKNAALIEKIGSLNNKARNLDAHNVVDPFPSNKDIKEKQLKSADSKADQVVKGVSSTPVITGFASASSQAACVSPISPVVQKLSTEPSDGAVVGPLHSHVAEASKAGKLVGSTHDRTRRRGDSSRNSHHGPAKDMPTNNSAVHGRGENSTTESSSVVQLRNIQHDQPPEHASQLPPVTITDDMPASPDYEFQRVKMKELAVQRAKQLQAEEEERTKRQKAKALAKLEELNKRSSVHQKNSSDPQPENADVQNKQNAGLDGTAEPAVSTTESRNVTAMGNVSILQPPIDPKDTAVPAQTMSTLPHTAGIAKDLAVRNTSSSGRTAQSSMVEHVAHKSVSQSHDAGVPKSKQGYRKRHAVPEDKTAGEKSSLVVSTENLKKTAEASLDTSTAVVRSYDDPPAHNKKSARNSRNKKKLDDAPATSKNLPEVLNQQNIPSLSSEPKPKTAGVIISSSILPTANTVLTVGSITVGGISFGSFNQERLKSPEEVQNTTNSRPRPQQAKGSRKTNHAVRPVEKPHGNEGVVWAPVKPSGWNEVSEEAEVAVAARPKPIGKCVNDGDNVTRTKRAEMERYVPKPLSKELQQQNTEQNLPSDKSSVENKSNDKSDAATEHKKWEDKKTSRGHGNGKSHPSWRKRNTDESALVVPDPSERLDSCQESHQVQRPSDKHQQLEHDKQADHTAGNSLAPTQIVELPVSAPKEHTAANRQRRQHVKAPKNEASNHSNENRDRQGRKDVNHMSTRGIDLNSSEHRNLSKSEVKSSAAVTHARAHWKPKSSQSQNNSQGNNNVEGQVDSTTLQDSSNQNLAGNSSRNGEKDEQNQGNGNAVHVDDNQKSESQENAEQQQLNHAARRQGHHNGRYQRGRGYDAGQPSHNVNAERRRGGTHLEYQPVGSHSKPADFQQNPSVDEQNTGHPAPGPVYRERGHSKSHRPGGHFVKRNPPSAPAPNSYQDE
ncbi:protein MODIFIER OF SNC1 1 [Lolium rigidum]|uniref:protein MODIFIER OF SNC1 1 n=1 Tax=Lolium rigidum TaxID=89674 RepID=UPI001F5C7DE9|nr:protein MODIFIER OF SNC1 1 [Lolium rigidum]